MSAYESFKKTQRGLTGSTLALLLVSTIGPALSQAQSMLQGRVSTGYKATGTRSVGTRSVGTKSTGNRAVGTTAPGGAQLSLSGASDQDVARRAEISSLGQSSQVTNMTPYADPRMWPYGIHPRWTAGQAVSIGGPSFTGPQQTRLQSFARIIPRQQKRKMRR